MTEQEAARILAILQSTYTDATVLPETRMGYALALQHVGYDEVMAALPEVMAKHDYPQRLPSPREIIAAIPTPWHLYSRYASMRATLQAGGVLSAPDYQELGQIERRIGVPVSCRLGRLAVDQQPRPAIGGGQ
jgi:hypothetical protein